MLLVVSQLVMATVLLVGAGLLVNSFINLSRVEKGYDPSQRARLSTGAAGEYSTARKAETIETLLDQLRATDVEAAGFAYAGILLGVKTPSGLRASGPHARGDAKANRRSRD